MVVTKKINRQPWYAALCSSIIPGAGQYFNGQKLFAGLFFFGIIGMLFAAYWFFSSSNISIIVSYLCFVLGMFVAGGSVLHGLLSVKWANTKKFEDRRKTEVDVWLAVFLSRFFPAAGLVYLKRWLLAIVFFVVYMVIEVLFSSNTYVYGFAFLMFTVVSMVVTYAAVFPKRDDIVKGLKTVAVLYLCLLTAIIVVITNLQAYYIPTPSMEPTFMVGDHILIKKYFNYNPKRGDIVIYRPADEKAKDYIKRCIAVAGDRFEIKNDAVFVNNKKLSEPYIKVATLYDGAISIESLQKKQKVQRDYILKSGRLINGGVVPEETIVVLGDNRTDSRDSRSHGYVRLSAVKGKALGVYWNGYTLDFSRVGRVRRFF